MLRDLTALSAVAALVLSTISASARDVPPCHSRSVNVEHGAHVRIPDAATGLLCLQGSRYAVHLEVRRATVATVLSALSAAYNISYHSSIPLNKTRDGAYAGSLAQVISRLLNDYDYVIKPKKSTLDVFIFDQKGEQAVAAAIATEVGDSSGRPAAQNSRNR
jgi:hypothetical protein